MNIKTLLIAGCFCLALIVSVAQAATKEELLELADDYDRQILLYSQIEARIVKVVAGSLAEKALKIRTEVLGEEHPDTLSSMETLARIHYKLGKFDQALPLRQKSYRLRKKVLGEKHLHTLTSLNNLAFLYKEVGLLNQALALYKNGYPLIKETLGEKHPLTLASLNNFALVYRDLDQFSTALPLFKTVYRLSKEVLGEKAPQTLISLNNLVLIYHDLGSLEKALPLAEKAYRLTKDVLGEEHPITLHSLNNVAGIYAGLARLKEALPLLEKGYRLRKKVLGEKHPKTLISLINLAFIHQALAHFSEARLLFGKSYHLIKMVLGEKHPNILFSLHKLAFHYRNLGRLEEALFLLENGYRLSMEVLGRKHSMTLSSLNNLAIIYQELGRLSDALPLLEKAYRLRQEMLGEKDSATLVSLNNLGGIYQELGRLDEALPLREKNYRLRKEVWGEEHPDTLTSLNNLAMIYKELGHLDKALPLLEKFSHLAKEFLGEKHPNTISGLRNLAIVYAEKGQIQKSIKHLEQFFVVSLESLRKRYLSAENRQALFKQWVKVYIALSRGYIGLSRSEDAFRIAEMSKARTLLESLAAKLAAQQSGLTAEEQQKWQEYDARLAFLNNRIAKALEANRLEVKIALETEKNQLVSKFNQFHRELMEKYPKYAQLSDVQIVDATEGAKHLPADAVLISYLVGEKRVSAFTLQADGTLTAHDLGEIPNFKQELANFRRVLSLPTQQPEESAPILNETRPIRFNPQTVQSLGSQLGKYLLEPLKEIIKDKSHWIISPDGPLALIPFETLRLDGDEQPVIAQHQISYVQSLSVLKLLQERDHVYQSLENRGTLLAMGAPIYEEVNTPTHCPSRTTRSPNPVDFKIAHALVHRSQEPQRYIRAFEQLSQKTWCNLPGAKRELKQLKNLFFFKTHRLRIYEGAEATEANLQRLNRFGILAKYRYLVFATHGYLSPQIPALSAIVLGQVNNPPGIDGYVTAGEWPGYNLKSDLMVLSACETGLGEVVSGEGVMGLPYAFYVAGNKNTLMTLWAVHDEMTAEFVASFFAKLKAGVGQIEALAATKREFINKGGRYSNPVYWAAFVLYGV